MNSKERYRAESSRPAYRTRRSYDISSSDSDDQSSDSYPTNSSDHHHQRQRRKRSPSVQRQHASDKLNGLTKAPQEVTARRRRPVSDSENQDGWRSRGYYSGSDDSETDSDSQHDDDSSSEDEHSRKHAKSSVSTASSKHRKHPKTRLEKKVDDILDAFGLLHIKNDPSKRQLASPDPEKYAIQKQALQAAVTAAAIEAWRSHSKPGGFDLQKVIRVIVAAIAAGGMDVLVESRPGHNKVKDIAEAVVGGLATSKTLGGKITHRREGGARGTMIDGFIALAASKMVKPPKPDEIEWRKKKYAQRSRSMEPTKKSSSRRR